MLALFAFSFLAAFLAFGFLAAVFAFSFVALVVASLLASLTFGGSLSLAAVFGAVVGAVLAVGGFALVAAHALVGAGAVHSTVVLASLDGFAGGGVGGDGLFTLLAVAGNHGDNLWKTSFVLYVET